MSYRKRYSRQRIRHCPSDGISLSFLMGCLALRLYGSWLRVAANSSSAFSRMGLPFAIFRKSRSNEGVASTRNEAVMTYKELLLFLFCVSFKFCQELSHRARLAFAVFRVTLCDVVGKVGVVKVQVIF